MKLRNTFLGLLALLFTACSSGNSFDGKFNKLTPTPTQVRTYAPSSIDAIIPSPTPLLPSTPDSLTLLPTPTSLPPSPTPTISESTLNIYQPTVTPTPVITPTQQPKEKRIVFVAGLCTPNSKDTFNQLESWIIENVGYKDSNFDYYNYTANGRSGENYDPGETLKSVDDVTDGRIKSVYLKGSSAENFKNFLMKLSSRNKDAEFYVIGHSLGGVIALYSFNTYPELRKIMRGILTVNSPLRGEGLLKLNTGRIFTCVKDYEDAKNLIPIPVFVDLKGDSQVIRDIDIDYSATGARVVTLANSNDTVLVSNSYSSGVIGTLDGAMTYIYSFGINPSSSNIIERYRELANIIAQHRIPLEIIDLEKNGKRDASEFVGRALRCMLIGDNCTYKK